MTSDVPSPSDRALFRRSQPDPDNPLDVKNPQAHASDAIFGIFESLQASAPVHWNPEVGDRGFWAVLGYDEVEEVLKRPEIFSADVRNGGNRIFDNQKVAASPSRMLLVLDPPEQADLRKAIAPFFSPEAVAAQQPRLRARAERLVSRIAGRGRAEFVSEVSAPYVMGLATDILGLPEDFGPTFGEWIGVLLADDDAEVQPSIERRREVIAAFDAFAMPLYRGEYPVKSDLLPILREVRVGGTPFDFDEFSVNLLALGVAFSDTTRHALSFAILALHEYPEQRQLLLDRPELIPQATKEIIRWTTPLVHVRRTALCDTVLGGRHIRQGDKIVVWYAAANRDPAKWHDPNAIDLMRFARGDAPASLAFGAGAHFCLGWRYAELELAIMLETLLERIPDIRPVGEARRFQSNFIRGIKALDVEFTPAS